MAASPGMKWGGGSRPWRGPGNVLPRDNTVPQTWIMAVVLPHACTVLPGFHFSWLLIIARTPLLPGLTCPSRPISYRMSLLPSFTLSLHADSLAFSLSFLFLSLFFLFVSLFIFFLLFLSLINFFFISLFVSLSFFLSFSFLFSTSCCCFHLCARE